jgi:hypothetical protein
MTAAEQKHNVLKLSKRVFVVFVNKPNTGFLSINLTQGFAGVPKNPAKKPCYNIIFSTILPFSH